MYHQLTNSSGSSATEQLPAEAGTQKAVTDTHGGSRANKKGASFHSFIRGQPTEADNNCIQVRWAEVHAFRVDQPRPLFF